VSRKTRRKFENIRILIVEDTHFFRQFVGSCLGDYHCIFAENGKAAIRKFMSESPHIVFTDLNLPDMSGYDVIQKIHENNPDSFIVVVSGNNDRNSVLKAKALGVQGFLRKPVSKTKLLAYVERYLAQQKEFHHEETEETPH
jgi:YesN/AraC family two-component response regulator